jgi:hypothetical protein
MMMWSHYADGHKGFCFQFDESILMEVKEANLVRVQYDRSYPTFKELVSERYRHNWPAFFLTRKWDLWKKEDESRLISGATGPKAQIFKTPLELPAGAVTAVILGCLMPARQKKVLRSWAAKAKLPIKVLEAELKPDTYGLDIPGLN